MKRQRFPPNDRNPGAIITHTAEINQLPVRRSRRLRGQAPLTQEEIEQALREDTSGREYVEQFEALLSELQKMRFLFRVYEERAQERCSIETQLHFSSLKENTFFQIEGVLKFMEDDSDDLEISQKVAAVAEIKQDIEIGLNSFREAINEFCKEELVEQEKEKRRRVTDEVKYKVKKREEGPYPREIYEWMERDDDGLKNKNAFRLNLTRGTILQPEIDDEFKEYTVKLIVDEPNGWSTGLSNLFNPITEQKIWMGLAQRIDEDDEENWTNRLVKDLLKVAAGTYDAIVRSLELLIEGSFVVAHLAFKTARLLGRTGYYVAKRVYENPKWVVPIVLVLAPAVYFGAGPLTVALSTIWNSWPVQIMFKVLKGIANAVCSFGFLSQTAGAYAIGEAITNVLDRRLRLRDSGAEGGYLGLRTTLQTVLSRVIPILCNLHAQTPATEVVTSDVQESYEVVQRTQDDTVVNTMTGEVCELQPGAEFTPLQSIDTSDTFISERLGNSTDFNEPLFRAEPDSYVVRAEDLVGQNQTVAPSFEDTVRGVLTNTSPPDPPSDNPGFGVVAPQPPGALQPSPEIYPQQPQGYGMPDINTPQDQLESEIGLNLDRIGVYLLIGIQEIQKFPFFSSPLRVSTRVGSKTFKSLSGCANCASPKANMACAGCKKVVYCNTACQKKHWDIAGHSQECF